MNINKEEEKLQREIL